MIEKLPFGKAWMGYSALAVMASLTFTACDHVKDAPAPAAAVQAHDATNDGEFLSFSDRAEFEAAMTEIGQYDSKIPVDDHLKQWEEDHDGFYSMRRHYYEQLLSGQGDKCPIRDIFFASVLSPQGVVRIGDYIFRVDAEAGVTYYIPADQQQDLFGDLLQPSPQNPEIHYFQSSDEALDLLEDGEQGQPAPIDGTTTTYAERCNDRHAQRDVDNILDTYAQNARIVTELAYQKYAVYFSIVGSMRSEQRTFPSPVWLPYTAVLSGSMMSQFKPRCWGYRSQPDSEPGKSATRIAFRPWESTRGLTYYHIECDFAAPGSGIAHMVIDDN